MNALKPIFAFTRDVLAEFVGESGAIDGYDYAGLLEAARLIVSRVACCPLESWPADARQFLALATELAVCLVSDRQGCDEQPGLRYLLACVNAEAELDSKPSKSQQLPAADIERQRDSLGVIRYVAREIAAEDYCQLQQKRRGE